MRATLTKNQTQLDIAVESSVQENNDQQIVNINEKLTEFIGSDEILLEVPVQADLSIECGESVALSDIQSDFIEIHSLAGIKTKNIKSEDIKLVAGGEIRCEGTTLAQKLFIKTEHGVRIMDSDACFSPLSSFDSPFQAIHLDKVLGDHMAVQSDEGSISIDSCYSQSSKITTTSGDLNLKNIHRHCEVSVAGEANLTMTGFNGNLLVTMNKGYIDVQVSELIGESVILANNSTDIDLKLDEQVTSTTYVHAAVHPDKLYLDDNLDPVRGTKENGASTLNLSGMPNKLFIQTDGTVRIKQQSWTESLFGGKGSDL